MFTKTSELRTLFKGVQNLIYLYSKMITMLQIKIKFFSGINQVNKYLLTSIESKYHENMSYN